MTKFIARLLIILGALTVASCNSSFSGGNAPGAPTGVRVVAGDGGVTVSWNMESGIEYWVFSAAASSIDTSNWTSLPQARVVRGAVSPKVITGLTNGTTYSFTVNGRKDGGAGGPGSPSASVVPRLTGLSWSLGTPLPSANLRALNFLAVSFPGQFTTVGDGGTVFATQNAINWTGIASGTTANLYGVVFGFGKYVAVGAGGAVITSVDSATWAASTSGTTNDLYSVATGNGGLVAVGANGTILRSGDGVAWAAATSNTTANLYNVNYFAGGYIAVGARGTVVVSSDSVTWTVVTTPTTNDLKAVSFSSGANPLYVAVGVAGTMISSTDGINWKQITPVTTVTLNAAIVGNQFAVVGDGGVILVSTDGATWQIVPSGTTASLYAISFGLVGFSVVGAGGVNLSSF